MKEAVIKQQAYTALLNLRDTDTVMIKFEKLMRLISVLIFNKQRQRENLTKQISFHVFAQTPQSF